MYRTLPKPWWHYLWLWIPGQLLIGYCVYKMVTQPGVPLLGAFVVWSLAITGTRLLVTVFLLHDNVSRGNWIAFGLLVVARIAQSYLR